MRTRSMIRNSLLATGLVLGAAVLPFGQVAAQNAGTPPSQQMQNPPPEQMQDSQQMQKASTNQTVPDKAADAWITTKVKSEFGTAKGIKATDISVSTSDGVVTLSGTVATEKEKMHAERVAKHVKGVKSVDASGLTVSAAPAQQ
ncbi:BON domain-containing protein [Rhodanobacter umsongensis]